MFELPHQPFHVAWSWPLVLAHFPRHGVMESQRSGMQHDARNLHSVHTADLSPSIGRIAQNRMTERSQVDTELMGAPGLGDTGAHVPAVLPKRRSTLYSVTGSFGRAVRARTFSFFGVTSNRQFDETVAFLWNLPDKRFIDAGNGVLFELSGQMPVSDDRSWQSPSRPRCLYPIDARVPAVPFHQCVETSRRMI